MNISQYIRMFVTSVFMLVMAFTVYAEGSVHPYYNGGNMELLSKETDIEKNLTNVKVSFNPVAEQISVSFKLTKQSIVSIKLMDALGNEILNLSNSTMDNGTHSLSFETEGKVTAGFYFIRVNTGIETVVKRVSVR